MKRFFTSLILLTFLIVSEMQLIHASDMKMYEHENHTITSRSPIFCETTGEHHENNCIVELIPHKIFGGTIQLRYIEKYTYTIPSHILGNEKYTNNLDRIFKEYCPPDPLYQKTKYQNFSQILRPLV